MFLYLIVMLLAALSWGCGSGDNNVAAPQTQAPPPPAAVARMGVVYLNGPVAGAQVTLLSRSGSTVGTAVTDGTGTFFFDGQGEPPYKAVAQTPAGSVEALVSGNLLWVDLFRHLVARYAAAHPEVSVAEAERVVKAGLSIPATTGTNGLSSLAGSAFAARLFLEQAARNGGLEAYSRSVVEQIGRGSVLAYRVENDPLALRLIRRSNRQSEVIRASAVGDLFSFLAAGVGSDLIAVGTNQILGATLAALGLNVGTSAQLNQVQQTLTQISSELTQLEGEVAAVKVSGAYNDVLSTINGTVNQLKTSTTTLASQAQGAAVQNATSTAFYHGPAVVPNGVTEFASRLSTTVAENATRQLLSFLVSTNASQNLVLLYNQLAVSQLFGNGNNNYAQNFYYSLRQDSWTAGNTANANNLSLQGQLNYYLSLVVEACNLWSEAGQLSILPQPKSQSGLNPPAGPLTASRNGVLSAQMDMLAAQAQLPQPLGYDQVFVDLAHNRMWYLQYMGQTKWQNAVDATIDFTLGPWTGSKDAGGYEYQQPYSGYGPAGGWRLATQQELEDLNALCGGTGLPGLAKIGFNVPSGSNTKCHVFGDPPYGLLGEGFYDYHYYDFSNGKTGYEDATGGGPLYAYLMVRNIPDYTSGDTAQIAHTNYGFLPDYLEFDTASGPGSQFGVLAVFGFTNGAPGYSYLTARARWSSSNPAVMDLSPLSGDGVVSYWHGPGSVTVTATAYGSDPSQNGQSNVQPQSRSLSVTLQSPLTGPPSYTSLAVSPYSLAYQAVPRNGDFQQFYLTGFDSGGRATDLTSQATWQVFTNATATTPLPTAAASFNPVVPGALDFGLQAGSVNTFVVQATYQGQKVQATVAY